MRLFLCRLVAVAVVTASAGAASFDCISSRPDPQRNPDAIAAIDTGAAAVIAPGKTYFASCPDQRCNGKAYLTLGDVVVTGETRQGWVCALYPGKKRITTGWLPRAALGMLGAAGPVPLSAWAGKWRRGGDATIEITVLGDTLVVSGQAFWQGDNPANIHDGEIEGLAKPAGGVLTISEGRGSYVCTVTLRPVGPYLDADDNLNCGGLNVTFAGIYRKN